jgi:hypothetical protein
MRMRLFVCSVLIAACLVPSEAGAQGARLRGAQFVIRDAIRSATLVADTSLRPVVQNAQPSPRRSVTRRVFGAAVGATAGFFAGGYTGAWIEGDRCRCDDPGLKGALIGAPIGAVAGGILGGLYLF